MVPDMQLSDQPCGIPGTGSCASSSAITGRLKATHPMFPWSILGVCVESGGDGERMGFVGEK